MPHAMLGHTFVAASSGLMHLAVLMQEAAAISFRFHK